MISVAKLHDVARGQPRASPRSRLLLLLPMDDSILFDFQREARSLAGQLVIERL